VGYVTSSEEKGRRYLFRRRGREKDNIKIGPEERKFQSVHWIYLTLDRISRREIVNTVINLWAAQEAGNI
jgi:hypothetical protein